MTRAFQKPLGVLAYYWSEGDDSDLNRISILLERQMKNYLLSAKRKILRRIRPSVKMDVEDFVFREYWISR